MLNHNIHKCVYEYDSIVHLIKLVFGKTPLKNWHVETSYYNVIKELLQKIQRFGFYVKLLKNSPGNLVAEIILFTLSIIHYNVALRW